MKYRYYIPGDEEQVTDLCEKNRIAVPKDAMVIVAEDDKGKIVGIAGLKLEAFFEPLISTNSIVSAKLFLRIMGACRNLIKKDNVKCVCDPKYEKLYNKAGFIRIEENKIIMEKKV